MREATRIDPKFARGHAQLAASLLFLRLLGQDADASQKAQWLRQAEASIHTALALDPDLSEAHGAYANLLRDTGQPGAEEQYRRALDLNPNNAASWHDYAVFLANVVQRYDESDRAMRKALELDPRQPVTWANYLESIRPEGEERYEAEYARALRAVGDMPGAGRWLVRQIWARDREDYRRQFDRMLREYQGDSDALDNLVFNGAIVGGFPVEILKAGLTKQSHPSPQSAPFWAHEFRAWQAVDPERAAQLIPEHGPGPRGIDFRVVRAMLLSDVTGRREQWSQLDEFLQQLEARSAENDELVESVGSVAAFWLTVQGRHAEAARWLARAGVIPDERTPPLLGNDNNTGLMEAATLQILRGTGRHDEAQRLAQQWLAARRNARAVPEPSCNASDPSGVPVRDASLFASEGFREEAVEALRQAMRCSDLPLAFWPGLPWFRALEGYPPYDALLHEYRERVAEVHRQLLELEAAR